MMEWWKILLIVLASLIGFVLLSALLYRPIFKRFYDFSIALVSMFFLMLVMIPIAILIKAEDKGPVFYCGKRTGKNGKPFKMYKFRSMKVDAPDIRLADGSTYNGEDDPRVTRIGKFIRKTSIDELPQLINILLGQMSIVGPRPDPVDWLDKYEDGKKDFLKLRPGITGYSQAYYRNSADGVQKIENDNYYAKHFSMWLDIKIFFKTIVSVFKSENLYVDKTREEVINNQNLETDSNESDIEKDEIDKLNN